MKNLSRVSKRKKIDLQTKQRRFINHLLECKWEVNHDYINRIVGDKEVDISSEVWGFYKGEYHLISPCKSFTLKVEKENATFWRRSPNWLKIAEHKIGEFEFIKNGIKLGIMEIRL